MSENNPIEMPKRRRKKIRNEPATEPVVTSVPGAARMIGVSVQTMWRFVYERQIASIKVGYSRKIPLKEIERFLEAGTIPAAS